MGGKKKTLEEAHYHISNGGITFKFVQVSSERETDVLHPTEANPIQPFLRKVIGKKTLYNKRYYGEFRTSHFGSGVTFRYPLGNPAIVEYLIGALQRVKDTMDEPTDLPTDGHEFAFRQGDLNIHVKHGKSLGKDRTRVTWSTDTKKQDTEKQTLIEKANKAVELARRLYPDYSAQEIEDEAVKMSAWGTQTIEERLANPLSDLFYYPPEVVETDGGSVYLYPRKLQESVVVLEAGGITVYKIPKTVNVPYVQLESNRQLNEVIAELINATALRIEDNQQMLESVTPSPKTLLISDKRDSDRIRKACGDGVRIIPISTLAPQTILAVKEPGQFGHISKRLDGQTAIMMSSEGIIPVYL